MKTVIGICGTTCVGKSAVAVKLAQRLSTEVISADSMQVYEGMDIGTAKITPEEMCGIRHHLLSFVQPNCDFSSFEYQAAASQIIDQMATLPIVVGGTGFYFDSLLYPPEFGAGDKQRRKALQEQLAKEGLEALCLRLKALDEQTYNAIDLKNPVRVLRALEIAECGEKRSQGKGKVQPRYDLKLFVLQRERQSLYNMIDRRVDQMVKSGLEEEVRSLVGKFGVCDTSAFSAIGYKEMVEYIQGRISLQQAIDQIKLNTRHYAKRQITYFKKMNVTKFVDVDALTTDEVAVEIIRNIQFV